MIRAAVKGSSVYGEPRPTPSLTTRRDVTAAWGTWVTWPLLRRAITRDGEDAVDRGMRFGPKPGGYRNGQGETAVGGHT